jgi:membrane protease YdiL (CAAX protease family)
VAEPDTTLLRPGSAAPRLDRRTVVVFAVAVVLLVVFEYWGLPSSFQGTSLHTGLADALGEGYRPYFDLLPYQYWGVSSVVLRVLLPLAVVALVLRESPRDWGWRFPRDWHHIWPYVVFLAVMVPVLFGASALGSFQRKYPFYEQAVLGGWHFWGWQLFYGLQILGVEAFFRGFLLFGLYPRLGWNAIPVMVIPYVMIHFGKPMPETFAAIVAGTMLGYLALRSRSFLWGALLHWSVAITMDAFVIGREIGWAAMARALF